MAQLRRFDRFQQRHRTLAIPCAVARKFGDDEGGNLAAVIAYRAFFSLFPMLLVFVTALGYALDGDPHAIRSVEQTVLRNFPGLGQALRFSALHGSAAALLVGVATAVWFGLAFTDAYRMLNQRIGVFVSLPLRALDQLTLQNKLHEIGRIGRAVAPTGPRTGTGP